EAVRRRSSLGGLPAAGVVHEDPPHRLRRDPEEVSPVLPVDAPLIDETEVGLVHEGGRLERVIGSLGPEVGGGEPPQLPVNEWQEPVEGARFAAAPFLEKRSDISGL